MMLRFSSPFAHSSNSSSENLATVRRPRTMIASGYAVSLAATIPSPDSRSNSGGPHSTLSATTPSRVAISLSRVRIASLPASMLRIRE